MSEEDYMSVYLKGRYDERDVWRKIIKLKIEDIAENSNGDNYNSTNVINILKELLKGE